MKSVEAIAIRVPVSRQTAEWASEVNKAFTDTMARAHREHAEHERRLREEPGYRERCERAAAEARRNEEEILASDAWDAIEREQARLFGLLSQLDEKRRALYAERGLTYTGYWDDE